MKILTINGKLKLKFFIDYFKNALIQLINYEPTLENINGLKFKCYVGIDSNDDYDIIDVIRILVKYCSNFKLEVDENGYYERDCSPYFIKSIYYSWDGKNLKICFKDYFGSLCEDVNFLLD